MSDRSTILHIDWEDEISEETIANMVQEFAGREGVVAVTVSGKLRDRFLSETARTQFASDANL